MPDTIFQCSWDEFEKFLRMTSGVLPLKDRITKAEIEVGSLKLEADNEQVIVTIKEPIYE